MCCAVFDGLHYIKIGFLFVCLTYFGQQRKSLLFVITYDSLRIKMLAKGYVAAAIA